MPRNLSPIDRFLENTARATEGPVICGFRCLVWTGYITNHGYGQVSIEGRRIRAHRLAYELAFGEIPEGLQVNHHCDNPRCVEPAHIYAGTAKDNVEDSIVRGRRAVPDMEPMHRASAARTREQRSEAASLGNARQTPWERSQRGLRAAATRALSTTHEQRSGWARKREAGMTAEARSERAKRRDAAMTPEARSERARKGHLTRQRNKRNDP